jgi:UDP-3-O-[3-hydroxymyristoyl] glucosamine N-acyltransferase
LESLALGELPPLAYEIVGDSESLVQHLATCQEAMEPGSLCFAEKKAFVTQGLENGAQVIITTQSLAGEISAKLDSEAGKILTLVVTPFPRILFVTILDFLEPQLRPEYAKGEPFYKDKSSCNIHPSVNFGPFCYVGAGVTIGADTIVGPRVTIEDGCQIGPGCHLHPGAILRWGVKIGARCQIHSGSVVGDDGFGYTQIPLGKERLLHYKNPHLGSVVLGDDVEVGALSAIDRGLVGDTTIGSGTKLDNLVQVGHNSTIGKDCILVAHVGVGGHSLVGDRVFLMGQSGLSHGVKVGDDAKITGQAGVTGTIPAGDKLWSGTPCILLDEDLKMKAISRRYLPQLKKLISNLKKSKNFDQLQTLFNSTETK